VYYACNKFQHYLLSDSCTIVCQHDVVKSMLQKPILSGRLEKWVYALAEYELDYKSLMTMKSQVVANFIVDHGVQLSKEVNVVEEGTWRLWFDGLVCSDGQCIGCFIMTPGAAKQELAIRLDFECTNNHAEYKALLSGLELLINMGARKVEVFSDSQLVIQQINGSNQCLDGVLNEYKEECTKVMGWANLIK
jgi:hypothetical protein